MSNFFDDFMDLNNIEDDEEYITFLQDKLEQLYQHFQEKDRQEKIIRENLKKINQEQKNIIANQQKIIEELRK